MIRVLIGHRGAGKTSFLERIGKYFSEAGLPVMIADLDQLIEERSGRTIGEIFSEGEAAFRRVESETFAWFFEAYRHRPEPVFLSLGAGFSAELPSDIEKIWVRRPTDFSGRVFLDRPRLNERVSPIQEYLERFPAREKRYSAQADWTWTVLEGWGFKNRFERAFVLGSFSESQSKLSGAMTILPKMALSEAGARGLRARLRWQGLRFELRDDLLSEAQIQSVREVIPADRLIYSFRSEEISDARIREVASWGCVWDFPVEKSRPVDAPILSLHERREGESVSDCARRLEAAVVHGSTPVLKLAIEIRNFSELLEGWKWARRDPSRRAFLPRSLSVDSGRWEWFRTWTWPETPLSFVREAEGSSADQPTLMQVLLREGLGSNHGFAAILGDPVRQSRTPAEQDAFFRERGMPVLSIRIRESEWDEALPVLQEIGLRAAAVTAPLKLKARQSCARIEGAGIDALNTLFWRDGWIGTNTDLRGFEALLEESAEFRSAVVWGGGGTLPVVRRVLPEAVFYSARTGEPREAESFSGSPEVLIWALGRSQMAGVLWPTESWRPRQVVDLNYSEDSPGREYARRVGAKYVSGLKMFQAQAVGQREFWERMGREGR